MKQTIKTLIITLVAVLVSTATAWADGNYKYYCNIKVSLNSPYEKGGIITDIKVDGSIIYNDTPIILDAGTKSIEVSFYYRYQDPSNEMNLVEGNLQL